MLLTEYFGHLLVKGPLQEALPHTLRATGGFQCVFGRDEVSLGRNEHRHIWYVGGDVLSVSALNVVSELILPRRGHEWGLPKLHLS